MNITCEKTSYIALFSVLPLGTVFRNIKGITFMKIEDSGTCDKRNAVALSNGKLYKIEPDETVIVYQNAEVIMN